jgi:tyrosine-protein kinase Etk/Wzc
MQLSPEMNEQSSFNLKSELGKYLKKWPWFVLGILSTFVLAWLYLRYTPKQYSTSASVLITTDDKKSKSVSLQDFSNLSLGGDFASTNLTDEVAIMKSKPLLHDVVKDLNLDLQFSSEGRILITNIYDQTPLYGHLDILDERKFSRKNFKVIPLNEQQFSLSTGENLTKTYKYGQQIGVKGAVFTIYRRFEFDFKNPLVLTLMSPNDVVNELEKNIVAQQDPKNKSTIISLNLNGVIPEKSENILNQLIKEYNKDAINNKNLESQNTAKFIDGRLDIITQQLGNIEDKKEIFKKENKITDLVTQAEHSAKNADEVTKQIMDVGTQLEMVNSILTYTSSANNEQLLPSNMGMPAGLDAIINEYNQLVLTRNRTLRQATAQNPAVIQFNRDISAMRALIKENLQKARSSLQMNISSLQQKVNESKMEVNKFPTQEKIFRNIDRQQNIKEALYLFLLQKREETSISLAVTTPKARVVNPAYTLNSPIAPQSSKIYLIALLVGFSLPFIIFYLIFFFDSKVMNKGDISRILSNVPLLAEVPTAENEDGDLISSNDLSIYAESFRILTTNLKFMIKKVTGRAPIILFTSSVKGEGKTTISVNSALSLSSNKKVILIGADLRNPQLKRYIPASNLGLSNYLSDESLVSGDVIMPSGLNLNLDIIDSGIIPPNPTDLLEDGRLKILLNELATRYDYVLIDSAPMMMVSDSFHLLNISDILVYVVRANYTEKNLLDYIKTIAADENIPKLGIVLNDVRKDELRYGYGGKYGYGYYTEEKKGFWERLLKKIK